MKNEHELRRVLQGIRDGAEKRMEEGRIPGAAGINLDIAKRIMKEALVSTRLIQSEHYFINY